MELPQVDSLSASPGNIQIPQTPAPQGENQHGGRDRFLCGGQTQAVPLETGSWPRVPARVRLPTSSDEGTPAEGLSSNVFVHLRTLPYSSRQTGKGTRGLLHWVGTCHGDQGNPRGPHLQEQKLSAL